MQAGDSARGLLMYSESVHRTVYPITIHPTPSPQFPVILTVTAFLGQMSSSYLPYLLAESSFCRPYSSAGSLTDIVKIEWTLSVSCLPGGMWLCQLLGRQFAVASMASSFADPQQLVQKGMWPPQPSEHHEPWGCKPSGVLNLSAALHVLPAPEKAFLWGSGSRFPPSHPLSAGCVPFPLSSVHRWRGLAVLLCSQTRIFPFPLTSEVWDVPIWNVIKILNLEFPAGWLVHFSARSIFQNVAIFLGRKEGFGFWVTQKFSKIFLKLNMQSFEMTQLLLSKLSKQQEVLDWFQSSKTVVETCFQSALDTIIYPHSYGNKFCCLDVFLVLNSSGEQSSVTQSWLHGI